MGHSVIEFDKIIKILAIVSFVPVIFACAPDHSRDDLAKCVAQNPKSPLAQDQSTPEELHDAMGETVAECMKRAGYKHDQSGPKCINDVDFNQYCYVRI